MSRWMIILPFFFPSFLYRSIQPDIFCIRFGEINYEDKSKPHPRLPTPPVYRRIIPIKEERRSWRTLTSSTYPWRHGRTIPHNYILIDPARTWIFPRPTFMTAVRRPGNNSSPIQREKTTGTKEIRRRNLEILE